MKINDIYQDEKGNQVTITNIVQSTNPIYNGEYVYFTPKNKNVSTLRLATFNKIYTKVGN